MLFFENSLILFSGLVIMHTAGTQGFMEKFCVKAGISHRFVLLASERSERDTIRGVQI